MFNSSFLQPNVASAVGLVRSKAQGVISVVPMEGKPVEASVTGSAKDLTGKVIPWSSAESAREGAIYNLAQFPISQRETLVFTIKVEAKGEPAQTFQFQQNLPGRMIKLEQLVLASHNAGKLKELQAMLGASVKVRFRSASSARWNRSSGLSFVENAILKARNAARLSGLPALADDSGLAVDFLGSAPGIYSARYADGPGRRGEQRQAAGGHEGCPGRRARRTVRQRAGAGAPRRRPLPILCEGIWEGRILREARGAHGFGYDPLFWVSGTRLLQRRAGAREEPPQPPSRAMALLKQRLGL